MTNAAEEHPEQGEVTAHDGLEWFESSIILLDGEGNFKDYLVGKVLDEATPGVVSVCVNSEQEASDMFLSWVAPDAEGNVAGGSNGSRVYTPVSENGLPQGTITYTPNPDNGDLAKVTFSDNLDIPNLRKSDSLQTSSGLTMTSLPVRIRSVT